MRLFNRKQNNSLPKEIKDYYQNEHRERLGVAWMLGFATLVVTLLLAAGLFYGGRWAYRAVFDSPDTETAQQPAQQNDPVAPVSPPEQDDSPPSEPTPGNDTLPDTDSDDDEEPASGEGRVPNTGPLPNTGPIDSL